jgi:hypothetical protein
MFRYDIKGVAQPDLVDKYTVSADGLTYTMTLKTMKYSDGVTPVTADDAVFSWEYSQKAVPGFISVTSVVAKDAKTVVYTLKEPFSDFPRALAGIYGVVNPRSKAEGKPEYWTKPLSAGPFRIKNWVVGSDHMMNWFQIKNPITQKLVDTKISDNTNIPSRNYISYTHDEVELVHSHSVGYPSIIQAGIPHNVTNLSGIRRCISIALFDRFRRPLTIAQASRVFAQYI